MPQTSPIPPPASTGMPELIQMIDTQPNTERNVTTVCSVRSRMLPKSAGLPPSVKSGASLPAPPPAPPPADVPPGGADSRRLQVSRTAGPFFPRRSRVVRFSSV